MPRYHSEQRIINRNYREHVKTCKPFAPRAKGYFRKQDAYDCGKPHCGICHSFKRELTRQEMKADLSQREQI